MNNDLYQMVIDKWGVDAQLTVVIEELSELAKEVCKIKRGMGTLVNIAEEVADVEIMCEQLRYIYDIDSVVDEWKQSKLTRLANRLK
jgi:NTP pyrophosphatase (non-canonical NTP hydrolase)